METLTYDSPAASHVAPVQTTSFAAFNARIELVNIVMHLAVRLDYQHPSTLSIAHKMRSMLHEEMHRMAKKSIATPGDAAWRKECIARLFTSADQVCVHLTDVIIFCMDYLRLRELDELLEYRTVPDIDARLQMLRQHDTMELAEVSDSFESSDYEDDNDSMDALQCVPLEESPYVHFPEASQLFVGEDAQELEFDEDWYVDA